MFQFSFSPDKGPNDNSYNNNFIYEVHCWMKLPKRRKSNLSRILCLIKKILYHSIFFISHVSLKFEINMFHIFMYQKGS